ncbi:MAG: LamG-like jellyroll fold domain-containing protein, partial [Myxococcales bacterium]
MLVGAPHASAQVCVPPPPGIVAWWPLDETAGRVANDIVGNHNGAYVDSVTVATPVAGKVAGGLRFGGPNDFTGPHVEVPDSDVWAFGSNDFTIELWANFDTNGTGSLGLPGDVFVGSDDGGGPNNKWFFALGGAVLNFHMFNLAGGGPNFVALALFFPVIGQWYHLAVTREGTL